MKPKYYPHITFAAAVLMLLLPASLLLLISSHDRQSVDEMIAAAESADNTPTSVKTRPEQQKSPLSNEITPRPATRVAMLSAPHHRPTIALDSQSDITPEPTVMAESPIAETQTPSGSGSKNIPPQPETLATNDPSPEVEMPSPPEQANQNDLLNQELEAALAQRSSTQDSHFESTGHLAMSGSIRQTQPRPSSPLQSMQSPTAVSGADPASLLDEDPFASEPKNPIVDIIIQQPSERRPVNKVENLIATTQQPGWPIALVRSDIPDDVWWVQQMVGIRNRSFASRVNFGNDNSIPGSVYHLTIVFLDSADEARRFRIAKQFKEIPEGLRRSREFTFVRK